MRRHGDAAQSGITKAHLRPYVAAVERIIRCNPENPAWAKLDAAWLTVVADAEAGVHEAETSGRAYIAWQLAGQREIARVGRTVPPREVVVTVLALYLMAEQDLRRFRGDRAFMFQLARRVRALTDANVGTTWDNKAKRVKRVYRDLRPQATEYFAAELVRALGAPALVFSRSQAAQEKEDRAERHALYEDIERLK